MLSDDWLQAGYIKGEAITLVTQTVFYHVWYDKQGKPIGVTIDFEYADDVHYDVKYSDWVRFLEEKFSIRQSNLQTRLNEYFHKINYLMLEEALNQYGIIYSKIAFY